MRGKVKQILATSLQRTAMLPQRPRGHRRFREVNSITINFLLFAMGSSSFSAPFFGSLCPWGVYFLSNILKNRQITLDFPRHRVILSFLF
jgi:hypothetical protein